MEAFKLLKSRTKLFIRVGYKVSFYFLNLNPTSTLPLICYPPGQVWASVFSSAEWVGTKQGAGPDGLHGFQELEEPAGAPQSLFSPPCLSSSCTLCPGSDSPPCSHLL